MVQVNIHFLQHLVRIVTNQDGSSNVACGWDRNQLGWFGWKNDNLSIRKDNLISAIDINGNEIQSNISILPSPVTQEFILRDFILTGDAIRIKLPHLQDGGNSAVKNQYLWIENHQKLSAFDKCAFENENCKAKWSNGLYIQLQVGKDITESINQNDVFGGLGSWLFPVSAEGNYDFTYRYDKEIQTWAECLWNNKSLPIPITGHTPNPLTGYSDLFGFTDSNGDGELKIVGFPCTAGDCYQAGYSNLDVSDNYIHNLNKAGDEDDAFNITNGKTKLNISTNPVSTPVYTYISNSFPNVINNIPQLSSFENRTIWLNGLSIEILSETTNSTLTALTGKTAKDIKVRIRWDNYNVENDVRWCGKIKLSPNDFYPNTGNYALNLLSGKTIHLDRGKSPTQHLGVEQINGQWVFTNPTTFTILPNANFHTEANSTVIVDNGSTFTVQSGSKLELHGLMLVKNGSKLTIENGAEVFIHRGGKIIIQQGATIEYKNNTANKGIVFGAQPTAFAEPFVEIGGALNLAPNTTPTFTGNGYLSFPAGSSVAADQTNKFILSGAGKTDLLLKLGSSAHPAFLLNEINLQNGLIQYGSLSSLFSGNSLVTLKNLRFSGPGLQKNTAFEGDNLQGFTCQNSDFESFGTALRITNTVKPVTLAENTFNNCLIAFDAVSCDEINLFTLTLAQCSTGFSFGSTRLVRANSCNVSYLKTGAAVNDVLGFYLVGGNFTANAINTTGISGQNSQVFLRNGALIDGQVFTNAVGIDLAGEAPQSPNDKFKAMLTMGDMGCGNIINCSKAVKGENVLLNVDAVEHSLTNTNMAAVAPNNLSGNMVVFDICYTSSVFAPPQIEAKGNFWRTAGGGGNTMGAPPLNPATLFQVRHTGSGTACNQAIAVNYQLWSTCVANTCMNCTVPFSNNPGGPGGAGNIQPPPGGGPPSECPAKIKLSGKTIEQAFRDANQLFLQEDKTATRANFKEIADLQLAKNNAGDNTLCENIDPNCGNGGGGGGGGMKISNPCAQLVKVSKVLYKGTPAMRQGKENPAEAQEQIQRPEILHAEVSDLKSEITVYPNPNDGKMTVEYYFTEGETGRFIIYDLTGRKISEHPLLPENNRLVLSESKLEAGVYHYRAVVNQTPVKIGKLTVIK